MGLNMQRIWEATPVIIVSYRTPGDVAGCLTSLDTMEAEPAFSVHICENGGGQAFHELCDALLKSDGPCIADAGDAWSFAGPFNRTQCFRLRRGNARVLVGEAATNLGYAGGINTWLMPLLVHAGWQALWILNPDTGVTPGALSALAAHAKDRNLGMVGSRTMIAKAETRIINMGLRRRCWMGSVYAVGQGAPAAIEPEPAMVEAGIDAANGASVYVSRPCAEALAPLDESYFLYMEDLDWGVRAKKAGYKIGYAHRSVVIHSGGSSIGSPSQDSAGSPFAIYLQFRSAQQFYRTHHPGLLPWTVLMGVLHALRLSRRGGFGPAVRGWLAGLKGETGRPEMPLPRQRASGRGHGAIPMRQAALRMLKAAISLGWLAALGVHSWLRRLPRTPTLTILYYHAIRPETLPRFLWQLSAIEAFGDCVSPDYRGSAASRPKIAITFDDAFQSVFDLALPELRKRGMPCAVFVPTACIGGAPTWEMEGACPDRSEVLANAETLRQAASNGVGLGAHARTHPRLTSLSADLERDEIAGSKADLEQIAGRTVDMFSFPYGDFNERTLQLCREAGYRFAYSITPAKADLCETAMLRPRIAVDPSDTKLEFWLKLRGAYSWMTFASRAKRWLRRALSNVRGNWRLSAAAAR